MDALDNIEEYAVPRVLQSLWHTQKLQEEVWANTPIEHAGKQKNIDPMALSKEDKHCTTQQSAKERVEALVNQIPIAQADNETLPEALEELERVDFEGPRRGSRVNKDWNKFSGRGEHGGSGEGSVNCLNQFNSAAFGPGLPQDRHSAHIDG
ncbi:hypothetical protein R3P38DRAFT_2767970 [Favolaschia claudopus]|uniref:Uncharacterized protein n=1 Tax=Favolaschia claudopus TaxID=2862362 RepID=A0AAW0CUP4_9AGAR